MVEVKKRRRVLQRTGLVTLLVGGALVLSGCWGVVVGPDASGKKALVMSAAATGQIVKVHCGGRTNEAGARCVLNSVRSLCHNVPLHGDPARNLGFAECESLASTGNLGGPNTGVIQDMQGAIWEVMFNGDVCLVGYVEMRDPPYVRDWTASPRGFACG